MCDILRKGPVRQVGGNNNCSINDLSDEILLKIFSYITPPALLLQILSKVCLRWKTLCSDSSLYRSLVFQAADPELSIAVAMVSGALWLKSLELLDRKDVDDILCRLGEFCPLLEKLVINRCEGSSVSRNVSSVHLRRVMTCCTKLRSLSLEGTSFTDETVYGEIGSKLPSLTVINFGCVSAANVAIMGIANHCVGVEELRIDPGDVIDEEVIRILCEKSINSLRILLSKFNLFWTDSTLESFSKCEKVQKVHIGNFKGEITEAGLRFIGRMPNVQQLELEMFRSISAGFWVDLLGSPNMMNLTSLILRYSVADDAMLLTISRLPNIEKLLLCTGFCHFTDVGLLHLSNMPKLVDLSLEPCDNVTVDGWKAFFKQPSTKNMTHLYFLECLELEDSVARVVMDQLFGLKVLSLAMCTKLSERMKTTLEDTMQRRGCNCEILLDEDIINDDDDDDDYADDDDDDLEAF